MTALEEVRTIIEGYNKDCKCGRQWRFVYAPRHKMNLEQPTLHKGDLTPTLFHVEQYTDTSTYMLGDISSELHYTDYKLKGFCGVNSEYTKQHDGELESDKQSAGKWETYIRPIRDCLRGGLEVDLCASFQMKDFYIEDKVDYLDQNYDGVAFKMTIRKYHQ